MSTPNPDTHCTSCGEVLSIYSHCWRCHYPPMDPKQDAPYCNGQCGHLHLPVSYLAPNDS